MATKTGLHYGQCLQRMLLTICCHSLEVTCYCDKPHSKSWVFHFSNFQHLAPLVGSQFVFLALRKVTTVCSGDKIPFLVLAFSELIDIWSLQNLVYSEFWNASLPFWRAFNSDHRLRKVLQYYFNLIFILYTSFSSPLCNISQVSLAFTHLTELFISSFCECL